MSGQGHGNGGGGGTSLAFGFSKSKAQRKVAVQIEEKKDNKQLIAGIEGSVIKTLGPEEPEEGKKTYVIPKLENTFKTGVGKNKFTPSFKPPANDAPIAGSADDKFVAAQADTRPTITEYGLEVRARPTGREKEEQQQQQEAPRVSLAQLEAQVLKQDLEELPDIPAVEVGAVLLRSRAAGTGQLHLRSSCMGCLQRALSAVHAGHA